MISFIANNNLNNITKIIKKRSGLYNSNKKKYIEENSDTIAKIKEIVEQNEKDLNNISTQLEKARAQSRKKNEDMDKGRKKNEDIDKTSAKSNNNNNNNSSSSNKAQDDKNKEQNNNNKSNNSGGGTKYNPQRSNNAVVIPVAQQKFFSYFASDVPVKTTENTNYENNDKKAVYECEFLNECLSALITLLNNNGILNNILNEQLVINRDIKNSHLRAYKLNELFCKSSKLLTNINDRRLFLVEYIKAYETLQNNISKIDIDGVSYDTCKRSGIKLNYGVDHNLHMENIAKISNDIKHKDQLNIVDHPENTCFNASVMNAMATSENSYNILKYYGEMTKNDWEFFTHVVNNTNYDAVNEHGKSNIRYNNEDLFNEIEKINPGFIHKLLRYYCTLVNPILYTEKNEYNILLDDDTFKDNQDLANHIRYFIINCMLSLENNYDVQYHPRCLVFKDEHSNKSFIGKILKDNLSTIKLTDGEHSGLYDINNYTIDQISKNSDDIFKHRSFIHHSGNTNGGHFKKIIPDSSLKNNILNHIKLNYIETIFLNRIDNLLNLLPSNDKKVTLNDIIDYINKPTYYIIAESVFYNNDIYNVSSTKITNTDIENYITNHTTSDDTINNIYTQIETSILNENDNNIKYIKNYIINSKNIAIKGDLILTDQILQNIQNKLNNYIKNNINTQPNDQIANLIRNYIYNYDKTLSDSIKGYLHQEYRINNSSISAMI